MAKSARIKHRSRTKPNKTQSKFACEYVKDYNPRAAAIRAGYFEHTAGQIGREMLRKPHVVSCINYLEDVREIIDALIICIDECVAGAKVQP